jgi:hypothetical protein
MDEFRRPDIVVVGTGRSGTSFASQVCHEDIGICMGHYLKRPNILGPKGFFEDLLAHGMTRLVQAGAISIQEYLHHLGNSHKACPSWGFKDPWFIELPTEQIAFVAPKLFIRTWRPLNACVTSWQRKELLRGVHPTEEQRQNFIDVVLFREAMLEEKLKHFNTLTVRFDKEVERDALAHQIRSCLCLH